MEENKEIKMDMGSHFVISAFFTFISIIPFLSLLALPFLFMIRKQIPSAKLYFWFIIIVHVLGVLMTLYLPTSLPYGSSYK